MYNDEKVRKMTEDILKAFRTPEDWNKMNNARRANSLVLSFIGSVVRPKNIPANVLKKCVEAFNKNHSGKIEKEIDTVFEVLEEGEKNE